MSDTEQIRRLEELVEKLSTQVSDLSGQVDTLSRQLHAHLPDDIPEEVALAISAAVAAYLGKRKAKRVRVRRSRGWAEQARSDIHHSHAAFGSRSGTRSTK